MSLADQIHGNALTFTLLPATVITAAGTVTGSTFPSSTVPIKIAGVRYLAVQCIFTYGSGGTTAKLYVQTSLDEGASWIDIIMFDHATASLSRVASATIDGTTFAASAYAPATITDGALTANTCLMGVMGDRFRTKLVTTGTYGGNTTITVTALAKG